MLTLYCHFERADRQGGEVRNLIGIIQLDRKAEDDCWSQDQQWRKTHVSYIFLMFAILFSSHFVDSARMKIIDFF